MAGNHTVNYSVSCGKTGCLDDMFAIGHAHPGPIEPVYFASEVDRRHGLALSWRACGPEDGTPSEARADLHFSHT